MSEKIGCVQHDCDECKARKGWIDVADCLPPDEEDVLCKRAYGLPPVVAGLFHGRFESEETGNAPRGTITHWMYIYESMLTMPDGYVAIRKRTEIVGNERHDPSCEYECCGFYSPCRGICAVPSNA